MAIITQLKNKSNVDIAPVTLMSLAVRADGQRLDELVLAKDNTIPFIPDGDYQPATKQYVDTKQKVQMTLSAQKPKNPNVGDIWFSLAHQYVWSEVDELGYTFANIDALNLTWADADEGGW